MAATAKTLQTPHTAYDTDFYGWARHQAELLRTGQLNQLDIEHIAEELDGLARSEKRELQSRLEVLLLHLLKWRYQPKRRGSSWRRSIVEQRGKIPEVLEENPSLKVVLDEISEKAYKNALRVAPLETKQDAAVFPETCPWTLEQVLSDEFWPESPDKSSL